MDSLLLVGMYSAPCQSKQFTATYCRRTLILWLIWITSTHQCWIEPPLCRKQSISPAIARRWLIGVSALFRHCLIMKTLTSAGTKLENFGEFHLFQFSIFRSMKSILKLNDWHRSSSNGWNNWNLVGMRRSEKKVKNETPWCACAFSFFMYVMPYRT